MRHSGRKGGWKARGAGNGSAQCRLVVELGDAPLVRNSNEPVFEDGLIRACAELNGADFIITRGKDAFAKSKVRSVTAAEYLDLAS